MLPALEMNLGDLVIDVFNKYLLSTHSMSGNALGFGTMRRIKFLFSWSLRFNREKKKPNCIIMDGDKCHEENKQGFGL